MTNCVEIRAILDSGADFSMIKASKIEAAKITPYKWRRTTISGIGESRVAMDLASCQCVLKGKKTGLTFEYSFQCVDKLCGGIAPLNIDEEELPEEIRDNLTEDLPRKEFSDVDLIIGSDILYELLDGDLMKLELETGKLIVWSTIFGPAISAKIPHTDYEKYNWLPVTENDFFENENSDSELTRTLKAFWGWETIGIKEEKHKILTKEEQYVDEHYAKNVSFEGGKYTVALPFCNAASKPINNFKNASAQFLHLERSLLIPKHKERCARYCEAIDKYISAGHVEEVQTNTPEKDAAYVLPHRDVWRADHETTKTRIVFNASARDRNGISLNDALLPGAKLQPDLAEVCLGFRKEPIALTGDISQMFLNINVKEEQRDWLRFIWRVPGSKQPLKIYRFKVLPFGLNCSPYLAIKTVKHHLASFKAENPDTVDQLEKQTYVDDYVGSGADVNQIIARRCIISHLMDSGRFHFSKWLSNSPEVMSSIPEEDRAAAAAPLVLAEKNYDISAEALSSALGMIWNPVKDTFEYQGALELTLPLDKPETMRTLCSRTAKFFDPLGYLGPFIVQAKMLMQLCWKSQLKWDDVLTEEINSNWDRWVEEVFFLHQLEIPRPLCVHDYHDIQLHGFSDASEKACAAVVYGRFECGSGRIITRLIMAKSKIAPLKAITIPHLELVAALLLARLMEKVSHKLEVPKERITLWSDSTTALQWMKKPPSSWKTYVGNRVAQIQELYEFENWRYVPTKENPADILSRGMIASELINCSMWFSGPTFLEEEKEVWPENIVQRKLTNEARIEEKEHVPFALPAQTAEEMEHIFLNDRPFWVNLRILAWIMRFKNNALRNERTENAAYLTVREIDHAMQAWLRTVQIDGLPKLVNAFAGEGQVTEAVLKQLQPFKDPDTEVIRVGGRLACSLLPEETKHPAIIPAKNRFVERYILALHKAHCHAGPGTLLSIIRTKTWLLQGRREVKRILRRCRCYILRAKPFSQQIAPLPDTRTVPQPPFTYIGMDTFGPIPCFNNPNRPDKSFKVWGFIATCCTSRACHIELLLSMDTNALINALKRTFARRGLAKVVYCDNAKPFEKVDRELQKLYAALDWQKIRNQFMQIPQPIDFRFNPAIAPHWGGHYERHVGSIKKALRSTMGRKKVNFDDLQTLMCQAEGIVNSRPLSAETQDPQDPCAVTPAHLVLGRGLQTIPDNLGRDDLAEKTDVLWRKRQRFHSEFWARWTKEYLLTLQPFSKWLREGREPKIGEIVLMGDLNRPRLTWPIGKIVQVYPSRRDDRTRMVDVMRHDPQSGGTITLKRDIRHLYKLEDN